MWKSVLESRYKWYTKRYESLIALVGHSFGEIDFSWYRNLTVRDIYLRVRIAMTIVYGGKYY